MISRINNFEFLKSLEIQFELKTETGRHFKQINDLKHNYEL